MFIMKQHKLIKYFKGLEIKLIAKDRLNKLFSETLSITFKGTPVKIVNNSDSSLVLFNSFHCLNVISYHEVGHEY